MPKSPPPLPYRIAPEEPAHAPAVEALIAESFGPERAKRTVYRFRDGRAPIAELAFVGLLPEGVGEAAGSERLVASLNFWEVAAPGGPLPLLGPLAVLPDLRGRGVGRALVAHGLAAARDQGWPAVLIVGDPGYYAPFGFSVGPVAGLDLPGPVGPLTFMGLEFTPGALSERAGAVVPRPL
ncbi:N-acetyltransferase [Marivibrio halodurans]|uniref:N-acetyltransferase n=1 Tax=Marivibrio halodurans TaxID=2039722 RepID=A0A8J7V404_9PROT|nr:N-acetyltransferase [Marivibrio halodurans]MBP5858930.1 N-acetyltransferase [Marivibrio halodurans]